MVDQIDGKQVIWFSVFLINLKAEFKQQQEQSLEVIAPPETEAAKDSSTFASSAAPNQLRQPGEWLTTGEAYQIASSRRLAKSQGTFRRWLAELIASGTMPPELKKLGLVADLKTRRSANPKDNSVHWLRFEE